MLLAYRPPAPPPTPADDEAAPLAPELGAPEQLLLGLMAIPMLEEKLSCVRLVGSFRPRVQAVSQAATTLFDACKVGRDSPDLKWDNLPSMAPISFSWMCMLTSSHSSGSPPAPRVLVPTPQEVRNSDLLLLILKISLFVGNFLNAGAHQGSAMGFHLDTLLKLKDVKSTKDKRFTLMHFIAR